MRSTYMQGAPSKTPPLRKKRIAFLVTAGCLACMAAALFFTGSVVSASQYLANKAADIQLTYRIQLANAGLPSPAPSTIKPDESEFDNYKVAAHKPRYIFIPSLAVKAIIKPVGLTDDNHIQAPTNVHHTGWFTGSAAPGQDGATVIVGHVSNWEARSVFHEIKKLKNGDLIVIERGDGQRITYAVAKSQSYAAQEIDMGAALSPITPSTSGLTLITCDGKVVKGNEYEKRLVVFATPVE